MSAPAVSESVSGRDQPRHHGPPVVHDVRFYGATEGATGYRLRAVVAECEPCAWRRVIDGGHTAADLTRLASQHAGTEDP
jgi:hypothetical protein